MDLSVAMNTALEAQTYLASLCALAMRLFPEADWSTVEPKLERGWHCSEGSRRFQWAEVRDYAQARWEARGFH